MNLGLMSQPTWGNKKGKNKKSLKKKKNKSYGAPFVSGLSKKRGRQYKNINSQRRRSNGDVDGNFTSSRKSLGWDSNICVYLR